MKDADLRRTLDAAGRQDAPPPDPAFVRDLEARLGSGSVAAAPVTTRRPLLPVAAAVVAVGALVGLVLGVRGDPAADRVQTEPSPSVTTSTTVVPGTTTTVTAVVPPPASVPTTTAPPVTVPAPTTTTPASTTTSTSTPPPALQELHLACTTDATGPTITCHWDRSTSAGFASFRLVRRTQDGPENVVYTGDGVEASERSGIGARLIYTVTALATDGRVLGRGTTNVTCC